MLAARLPGNSTYDNPRQGWTPRCRGLPHVPCREGQDFGPYLVGPGPVLFKTGGTPGNGGSGVCRGFLWTGNPPQGRTHG